MPATNPISFLQFQKFKTKKLKFVFYGEGRRLQNLKQRMQGKSWGGLHKTSYENLKLIFGKAAN
jgi:hypothetical protein